MKTAVLVLLCSIYSVSLLAEKKPDDNFYQSGGERFRDYLHRTYTDPGRFAWLLVNSAQDTWFKDPHQWDRSAESYSYRVASAMGRRIVRNTLQLAFEAALDEDSRYRRCNERGLRKRALYAIGHSVLAYTHDGSIEPAYGRIAAGVAGAAASSTWHPQSIDAKALVSGAAAAAMDRATNNLLTEFQPDMVMAGRKMWKRVWRQR